MESLNQCRFFSWCRKGRIRRIRCVGQGQRVPGTEGNPEGTLANRGSGSGCLAPATCLLTLSQNTISSPGCFPLRSLRLCGETQDPFRSVDQRGAFRLVDQDSGRLLGETLEIHTLELGWYDLQESELETASLLDRWLYWLLHAHQ
jgi:hypothetical protein